MPTSNETTPKSKESTSMGCGSIFQCIRNSFSSSKKIHKNDYQSIPRLFPPPPPEVRPNHFSNMIMPSFPGDNGDDTTWAAVEITNGMSDEVYSGPFPIPQEEEQEDFQYSSFMEEIKEEQNNFQYSSFMENIEEENNGLTIDDNEKTFCHSEREEETFIAKMSSEEKNGRKKIVRMAKINGKGKTSSV